VKLFGRRQAGRDFVRLFFATDLHGSTRTFKKLLSAAHVYDASVLVMGGDVTGKVMVPIVDAGNGTYDVMLHGEHRRASAGDELAHVVEAAETQGQYHAIVSRDEYEHLRTDPSARDAVFRRLVRERLEQWRALADERLGPLGVKCFVTGGNDDEPETLAVLEGDDDGAMVFCEGRVVMIDDHHSMVSCGWSNPTPWKTPRETSEEALAEKLEACVRPLDDVGRAIFNFHPPPRDSTLDVCPALDDSTDPPSPIFSGGQPLMTAAGSTAVRDMIERSQPLLGLHGHIHESRAVYEIGRTLVVNPGSEYGEGFLRGCLVNLTEDKVLSFQMTSG
jgi:Icc-related predicted phosphoesterase